jgi:hypothetical protein
VYACGWHAYVNNNNLRAQVANMASGLMLACLATTAGNTMADATLSAGNARLSTEVDLAMFFNL